MSEFTEKWRLAAAEYLDLQDAADVLNEAKHITFAEIVSRTHGNSNAEKERHARLTDEWKEFTDKLLSSNQKARRAKLRLTFVKMQRDDQLNSDANRRAEMRI